MPSARQSCSVLTVTSAVAVSCKPAWLLQNAERLLLEAMEELRNPGPIGDSNPSLQQPQHSMASSSQQAADNAPEQTGLLTQYTANVGSMLGSIGAMALGPGPAGSVGNLCVAVNYTSSAQLDLYVGCKERGFKSQGLEKQSKYQVRSRGCWARGTCMCCMLQQQRLQGRMAMSLGTLGRSCLGGHTQAQR